MKRVIEFASQEATFRKRSAMINNIETFVKGNVWLKPQKGANCEAFFGRSTTLFKIVLKIVDGPFPLFLLSDNAP